MARGTTNERMKNYLIANPPKGGAASQNLSKDLNDFINVHATNPAQNLSATAAWILAMSNSAGQN